MKRVRTIVVSIGALTIIFSMYAQIYQGWSELQASGVAAVGALIFLFAFVMMDVDDNMAAIEQMAKKEPPMALNIGDVVNLKVSAHPKMVINYRTMSGYACCWFDDSMVCQEHIFAEDALVLVKKSEG